MKLVRGFKISRRSRRPLRTGRRPQIKWSFGLQKHVSKAGGTFKTSQGTNKCVAQVGESARALWTMRWPFH